MTAESSKSEIPDIAADAVLVASEEMPAGSEKVAGYDYFNQGIDHHQAFQFSTQGSRQPTLGWLRRSTK